MSTYDWWAQIWIPTLLGALTIGITTLVAVNSVRVAKRSNELAERSIALAESAADDSRRAARLQERIALGVDLVDLLEARALEQRGTSPAPSAGALYRAVRPKLAFVDEPGSEDVLEDVMHMFDGVSPTSKEGWDEIKRLRFRGEFGIGIWVREPDRYADWAWRRDNPSDEPIEPDFDA